VLLAAIDELTEALARLQTTLKLLTEEAHALDHVRSAPRLKRARLLLGEPEEEEPPPSRSLRFTGMTVPEAARALSLSEEHVRRLLRRRELAGVAYGGRIGWRLNRADVEAIAARRRGTTRPRRPRKVIATRSTGADPPYTPPGA
jgi:excisionase family DNA binding protein